MTLPRRRFLRLAAGAAAAPVLARTAHAQTYPNRPVRLIVGLAPGGVNDLVARLIAQWLTGAARPDLRGREPSGLRRQHRDRGGREVDARRLYASPAGLRQSRQCRALSAARIRSRARHRAGRHHHAPAQRGGGKPVDAREDDAGVRRLRQGQSRQDQHGVDRQRDAVACRRRAVQDDDRRPDDARAVSRRRAGADRSDRRAGADLFRCAGVRSRR